MRFNCPQCKQALSAPDEAAGRRAKCKHCQTSLTIPPAKPPGSPSTAVLSVEGASSRLVDPAIDPDRAKSSKQKPVATGLVKPQHSPQSENPFGDIPDFSTPAVTLPSPKTKSTASSNASSTNSANHESSLFDALTGIEGSVQEAIAKQKQKQVAAIAPKVSVAEISKSFRGEISLTASPQYSSRLLSVATTMLILPALFVAFVVFGTLGVGWIIVNWMQSESTGKILNPFIGFGMLALITLLLASWIPVFNILFSMFSILFSGLRARPESRALTPENQPVLYEFVNQICNKVSAPHPTRIELDCDYNASASFRQGWMSFGKNDLVLTLGVPLIASQTSEQLASVIAHEFGHFRQGQGMKAHYMIRSLSGWFMNSAYQGAYRAEVNAYILSNSEHGVGVIWAFFYVVGIIGRAMMWCFGYAAHALGGSLSREMEFDADRYAVSLAGSNNFVQSMTLVEKYGVAYQVTIENLRMLFMNGVLVDNIPRLMMHIAKTMPATVVQQIAKSTEEKRVAALDSHPPTRERNEAAKQLNQKGIVQVGRPATDLVHHWSKLCEDITLDFYSQVTGEKIEAKDVTKLEDILLAEHKLLLDKAS